jgi:putative membrane protein insertion efficiency factor
MQRLRDREVSPVGVGYIRPLHCAKVAVAALLRLYKRWLSPLLPSACRYYPTCSEYMLAAVEKHGALKGVWLGLKRLFRCHPFHAGGFDPVR